MTIERTAVGRVWRLQRIGLAPLGYAVLAAVVGWWTWRAYHDRLTLDVGLAYQAGQVAWSTGHPEHLYSWDGTPFLAAVMALVTRVMSGTTAAHLLNALNVGLVLGVIGVSLRRLRGLLSPTWWWLLGFGLVSFGPMMSSVWWKQFNVIALALAIGGFELLRRGRTHPGAGLIGLSISVKPLLFLLPFVLLVRRETRRAGALALGWAAALNLAAQGLMAARAGHLATLSAYPALHNFLEKARPANEWACDTENFAPGSLLCRLAGTPDWTAQHIIVGAAVVLLGIWVVEALRGRGWLSWELFAFTCPLSVMLSPLAWSHYQILLAPLFVLLLVRFTREGAVFGAWAGLAVAFLLASLVWRPYGTVIGAIRGVVSNKVETQHEFFAIASVAQFAQYVLVLTGIIWYGQRGQRASEITHQGG
jgi:hypothetical protein